MNRIFTNRILMGLILVFLIIITSILISNANQQPPATQITPSPIQTPTTPPPSNINPTTDPTTTPQPPLVSNVNIYFIAIDDNGKSGPRIGCGDSVIPVKRNIPPTTAPLRAAINELLSERSQFIGQTRLYNSLYQSNLKVDNISIDSNAKATINLSGTVRLGGSCDNPRFEAQLKQTALQFSTVKQVQIFVNDTPIDQVVSGR